MMIQNGLIFFKRNTAADLVVNFKNVYSNELSIVFGNKMKVLRTRFLDKLARLDRKQDKQ